MLEDVKESYVEAISAAFPLHRVIIVFWGFISAIAVAHQDYLSIIETILRFQISGLSFEENKLLEHATLFDCLWGFALCFFSFCIYNFLAKSIFLLVSKSINYEQKVEDQRKKFAWISRIPHAERGNALARAERKKKEQQSPLRWRSIAAETALAFSIAAGFSSFWGNALDVTLSGLALLCSIALQANLIYVFLGNYLGSALQESMLNEEQNSIVPPA